VLKSAELETEALEQMRVRTWAQAKTAVDCLMMAWDLEEQAKCVAQMMQCRPPSFIFEWLLERNITANSHRKQTEEHPTIVATRVAHHLKSQGVT